MSDAADDGTADINATDGFRLATCNLKLMTSFDLYRLTFNHMSDAADDDTADINATDGFRLATCNLKLMTSFDLHRLTFNHYPIKKRRTTVHRFRLD